MTRDLVRWGIIGAGNIARHALAPAMAASGNGLLAAVASRGEQRARQIAEELSVDVYYPSYEALLASSDVDAVYIGLPNGLHEEWTCRAAAAGKHVLCEKALTLSVDSAERMASSCREAGVLLMEAFMYRHHRQWRDACRIVASGQLGQVRSVHGVFIGNLTNLEDHRWSAELGGGALFDVGCYPVNAARYILDAEPLAVSAMADLTTPDGVDRTMHVVMKFPNEVLATAIGGLAGHGTQGFTVVGTEGRLEIDKPFVPGFAEARIRVVSGGRSEEIVVPGENHFASMVRHFAECVLGRERSLYPGEDGVASTRALCAAVDSILRA